LTEKIIYESYAEISTYGTDGTQINHHGSRGHIGSRHSTKHIVIIGFAVGNFGRVGE
jgi:hypothetical protein